MAKDQHTVTADEIAAARQAIADYISSGTSQHGDPAVQLERQHERHPVGVLVDRHRQRDVDDRPPPHRPGPARRHPVLARAAAVPGPGDQTTSSPRRGQATALAHQDQSTLDSVDANIQTLVAQKQAAEAAAATAAAQAAFNQKVAGRQGRPGPDRRSARPPSAPPAPVDRRALRLGRSGGSGGGSTTPSRPRPRPAAVRAAGAPWPPPRTRSACPTCGAVPPRPGSTARAWSCGPTQGAATYVLRCGPQENVSAKKLVSGQTRTPGTRGRQRARGAARCAAGGFFLPPLRCASQCAQESDGRFLCCA